MALRKTEAVILRRQEIRETSLMLIAFSRDLGKFQGLVKGVRGARAAVPWYLEPLTLQSVVLYERRRSPWALVSSCDLIDPFDALRRDFRRTAYGALMLDLVDAMTEVGESHPDLFAPLVSLLRALGEVQEPRVLIVALEARLLQGAGLLPPIANLTLSAEAKRSLQEILQILPAPPSAAWQRFFGKTDELGRLLDALVRRALGRELKSRMFLYSLGLERPGLPPQREPLEVRGEAA